MQRFVTVIAKSIKNSSRIRYSINSSSSSSSSKSIIIQEFQQRGRFRSTSSILSNYPNNRLIVLAYAPLFDHCTTVRSFSSSTKELAQLVDNLPHLLHPVASSIFCVYLIAYLWPRFFKFIYDTLPTNVPYEVTFFPRMVDPIYMLATGFAFTHILYTIDPALTALNSIKSCSVVAVGSWQVCYIHDRVKEIIIRLNLPFSVGDTIKIRYKDGYLQGTVTETGQTCYILITDEHGRRIFHLPYSKLSTRVIVRSIVLGIPLKIHDADKISRISKHIIEMMNSNANVSFEMGLPYCECSQESSYVKLTLGCDVKNKKSEKYILQDAIRIIKEHGGELTSDAQDGQSKLGH